MEQDVLWEELMACFDMLRFFFLEVAKNGEYRESCPRGQRSSFRSEIIMSNGWSPRASFSPLSGLPPSTGGHAISCPAQMSALFRLVDANPRRMSRAHAQNTRSPTSPRGHRNDAAAPKSPASLPRVGRNCEFHDSLLRAQRQPRRDRTSHIEASVPFILIVPFLLSSRLFRPTSSPRDNKSTKIPLQLHLTVRAHFSRYNSM